MKKTILIVAAIIIALLITSCGHNFATQSKGIGIDVSWTGESYIPNVRLGYWDDTTTVVRGNTTVSASTATGSGLMVGQGGTSQTLQIATGTQINQGYIKDILTDPNLDTEAKVAFIKALTKLEKPSTDGAHNKVTGAESNVIKGVVSEEELQAELETKKNAEAEEAIDELVQKLEAMEKAKAQQVSETKEVVNKATAPKAVPAAEQK